MDSKKGPSVVEWGLVIGALITVDIVQIVLDALAIGLIANRFIDIFVALCFALYLVIRVDDAFNPKRVISLMIVFLVEMAPGIDVLPLWTADGIFQFTLSRATKVLAKHPVVNKVVSVGSKVVAGPSGTLAPVASSKQIAEAKSKKEMKG